ncbi:MAG: hypothetical protein HMLKMBBP_02669 [Planctomycetes bacterium]|nr:hypothetical protein [Planctomycetota bacterium]
MMRRLLAACVALAALACLAAALGPRADAAPEWRAPPTQPPVRYAIQASLDTIPGEREPRRIAGGMTVLWTNTSAEPVSSLWFHAFANAFADEKSTFIREAKQGGAELPDDMRFGGIDIDSIEDAVLRTKLEHRFVRDDDGNPDDRTVLRVALKDPVEPGATVRLRIEFATTLPRAFRRMGAWQDFVFAAQWYPKLGRHLGTASRTPNLREGWYCAQYHSGPEFCADFADFDVTLKLPDGWTSAATGVRDGAPAAEGGVRTETWRARGVVDFAWTAGRRSVERKRTVNFREPPADAASDPVWREILRVRDSQGTTLEEMGLGGDVEVVLLLQPEHLDQEERHFEAARTALGMFGAWFGPYPYPRLTIVDPPHGAGGVGGMEYPTLVTTGTSIGSPQSNHRPETVIVHEIGHQWFMGILASNESEEAWLDEGLTTWATARALHLRYGASLPLTIVLGRHFETELPYTFPGFAEGFRPADWLPKWAKPPEMQGVRLWRDLPALATAAAWRTRDDPMLPMRRSYLRGAGWDELVCSGWRYASGDSYRVNAYPRPVLLMESLARTLADRHGAAEGETRMTRAVREYARQHRFRHPTGEDLLRAIREHAELDPAPLWESLARASGLLDYELSPPREAAIPASSDPKAPPRTEIVVRRKGEVSVPVTLRVVRKVGDAPPVTEDLRWDGRGRRNTFVVEGKVLSAELDPGRIFLQDANRVRDAWTERADPRPAVKWGGQTLLWLEHALTTYGQFL